MGHDRTFEDFVNSAMVADISEKLFGGNARNAPMYMANTHAGWACGPVGKGHYDAKSYVEMVYKLNKQKNDPEWLKEWEEFLEKIETLFKKSFIDFLELKSNGERRKNKAGLV